MEWIIENILSYPFMMGDTGTPLIDLYETTDEIVIEVDLPGVEPDDISIKVANEFLMLEGIKREKAEEKRLNYICMERSFESFRRIIRFPHPVNLSEGKASYIDGVLRINFPKAIHRIIKIDIEKQ